MTLVSTTRKEYDDLLKDVKRNRAAVAGERTIKEGTTEFLPPLASMTSSVEEAENGNQQIIVGSELTAEGRASYRIYLSLAYFYGATGRTVDGLTGLIFSKKPIKELNTSIDYLNTNVNGRGDSLRKQSQKATEEAFITPQSGLLVDFPNVKQGVSFKDAEDNNLRPKILHYPFESIINWHYDVVNNQQKLTMLVLKESSETMKDRFEVEIKTIFRVLEIVDGVYVQTIFDDDGQTQEERKVILVNGKPSNEIPFYFIQVGAEKKSVINDLVDANLNHYRFFADYAAKEHASAFPIFWETGVTGNDGNIMVGPGAKWTNQSTDAQFGVIQTESDGGSMKTYLLDMEQRMAALGAEMLRPRISGAESAEAKTLDQVAQNSTTGNVAINVSEAYTKALNFCSRWLGGPEDVVYELNTDYNPSDMNPQLLTALMMAEQSGQISYATFYENLKRGEIANPDRTAEEEKTLITNEETGI